MRKLTAAVAAALLALAPAGALAQSQTRQQQSGQGAQAQQETQAQPARLSAASRAKGFEVLNRAIGYLRTQQDEATGGWSVNPDGATFPAITGLVIDGMLQHPAIDASDPAVARGIGFLLSHRQPDGGIYDLVLPSYNTAISISALSRADVALADAAIPPAQSFLVGLQWSEDSLSDEVSEQLGVGKVTREHPFYGGIGYGRNGRPDISNLQFMLQALHDSGYDPEGPAFRRALVFLERIQMHEAVNPMPYAAGATNGGFIYATSPSGEEIGVGQSQAGTIEETLDDGTVVSRLRSYGSVTYAGFKSYAYADLPRDDLRVSAARDWIGRNYTLEENPGIGLQGFYYYLLAFGRSLDAWGEPTLEVVRGVSESGEETTEQRRWAEDLIDRLAELQEPDGSFRVLHERWMESDPVLITAYSVIALQAALDNN